MGNEQQTEEKRFVEEVGILFEQTGMPRMAGRILGWLSVSDSPHQTTSDLAEALMASKGSISTMTRFLIRIGLIERISLLGQRRDYFRNKTGACHQLLGDSVNQSKIFRQLMDHGLELTEGKARANRQWLEEMRDMYVFMERELPALVERWEQEQKRNKLQIK